MSEETAMPEEPTGDEFQKISFNGTSNNNGSATDAARQADNRAALETTPTCERCADARWVRITTDTGSTIVPCGCRSADDNDRARLKTYSQLGYLERMTFDALSPDGRPGRVDAHQFRDALIAAHEFAAAPRGWLVLDGPSGVGKTHLAAGIVNAIIARGDAAKYVSALDLPEIVLNERHSDEGANDGGTFASLMNAPLLVLDDLGAQRAADWIDAKLDQLLTHRFNAQLPTVVALAAAVGQLPERIALKLQDPALARTVALAGGDAGQGYDVNVPRTMLQRMTFDTFDTDGARSADQNERASLEIAVAAARAFAHAPRKWLYLHGPTGVGKTHLAVAIAGVQIAGGTEVTFWSVPDLLDALRRNFSNPDESGYYRLFDTVRNCELLILDDFGAQRMTEWALEKIYQIVSYRHDRLLPTVITSQYIIWDGASNGGWSQVRDTHLWQAIRSRLNDSTVVTERLMAAPDYRDRRA